MKRLKLAYIFDNILPAPTAESEQLVNTMAALSLQGYEVTLFVPCDPNSPPPTADDLRRFYHVDGDFYIEPIHSYVSQVRLVHKTLHPLLCRTWLIKRLRQFDLVYSRNIPAIIAALSAHIPAFYDTYRPWVAQYHHALWPLFKAFFAHPKFIGIAAHSEFTRQSYLDFGAPKHKVITAHNGYNPALLEPVLTIQQARQKLGLPMDEKMALYSGRMDPEKGIPALLDIAEKSPNVHFYFIGSHHHGPLEVRAEKLKNVSILGWIECQKLAIYLYAADVLMLPPLPQVLNKNSNTVLPLKLYTYFAASRAIFAPFSDDTKELLNPSNACLFDANNPKNALETFQNLIFDDQKCQQLAEAAHQMACQLKWQNRAELIDKTIKNWFQNQNA